jgi:hypothetical protein
MTERERCIYSLHQVRERVPGELLSKDYHTSVSELDTKSLFGGRFSCFAPADLRLFVYYESSTLIAEEKFSKKLFFLFVGARHCRRQGYIQNNFSVNDAKRLMLWGSMTSGERSRGALMRGGAVSDFRVMLILGTFEVADSCIFSSSCCFPPCRTFLRFPLSRWVSTGGKIHAAQSFPLICLSEAAAPEAALPRTQSFALRLRGGADEQEKSFMSDTVKREKKEKKKKRMWIGDKPLPANIVRKIEKKAAAVEAKRRESEEAKKLNSNLKFDPENFREFVSSFRKSKLKRKAAASDARKKQAKLASKQASAQQREKDKIQAAEERKVLEMHRLERADAVPQNDPLAVPCSKLRVNEPKHSTKVHSQFRLY